MAKYLFAGLIVLAALLRFSAVQYGLPLRLIADEPQFILTALGMAEMNTLLIPRTQAFMDMLYNTPYVAYFLFVPSWILFHVVKAKTLVPFFIVARLLSVTAGLATIWLVYKITKRIFGGNSKAPFFSAYFLATSILAVAISATARHWSFAMFVMAAGLWVLAVPRLPFMKRYIWLAAIAGFGMGVNQTAVILMVFAVGWYLFVENGKLTTLLSMRWFYAGISIFIALTALPLLLYTNSLNTLGKDQFGYVFSLGGLIGAPYNFLSSLIYSEPIFLVFVLIGFVSLWRKQTALFWIFFFTVIGYAELFYFTYTFEHRYLSALLPFLAIIAGSGAGYIYDLSRKSLLKASIFWVLLVLIFCVSLRFGYLAQRGDSRSLARSWFEDNVSAESKVIVWGADLMRLSAMPDAIREKATIQEDGDMDLDEQNELYSPSLPWGRAFFYALNLQNVHDGSFYKNIKDYSCIRGYDYLITVKEGFGDPDQSPYVAQLKEGANLLVSFGDSERYDSMTATRFSSWPWNLFEFSEFGPPMEIYRLNREILCDNGAARHTIFNGSDFVKAGAFNVYSLNLDKANNIYISIIAPDKGLEVFILTDGEFENFRKNQTFRVAVKVQGLSWGAHLKSGKYMFLVISKQDDIKYTLHLQTDQ